MRWLAGVALGFVAGCVLSTGAQQANAPSQRVQEYITSIGMRDSLEKQRTANLAASRAQLEQMLAQMSEQVPELPRSYLAELSSMTSDMAEAVGNSYTVDEAIAVYGGVWDRAYPGNEIDVAMAQLETPEGRKLANTIGVSFSEVTQFVQQRRMEAMQRESNRMVARFRELLDKSRARKQNP
jgi:hypothetical protein